MKKDFRSFDELIAPYQNDEHMVQMKDYVQHGSVTTYDHCIDVARVSYEMARHLPLQVNERTLVVGALLHDFYLYDWHIPAASHRLHGFTHPRDAETNARRYYHVDDDVAHVIRAHMWPFTLFHLPHSREAVIVCLADKYCSAKESLLTRKKR